MTEEGEKIKENPSAQSEVLKYPDIPEIPNGLNPYLFGAFQEKEEETIVSIGGKGTWIVDYFIHEDTRVINLFNDIEYRTIQARLFDNSNMVVREIKRERTENIIKWSYLLIKDKSGNWVKLSSDQNPNGQQP